MANTLKNKKNSDNPLLLATGAAELKAYFDQKKDELLLVLTQGPQELDESIQVIALAAKASRSRSLPFFAVKVPSGIFLLYTNGSNKALMLSNGSKHYFYDILKGAAATPEVVEVLKTGLMDISKEQSHQLFTQTHDVGEVREELAKCLKDKPLHYALKQMAKQVTEKPLKQAIKQLAEVSEQSLSERIEQANESKRNSYTFNKSRER